jgi:prolyl-tRNA synthetase
MAAKTAIQPTRAEDYPQWYQQVIRAADLAETTPVRGCMVIKPWGYALWENIQADLDRRIKETGHQNAYFPLFIPKSFLQKEAEHVEGFAKECAVVTHSRLEMDANGQLQPASPLEEPLVVRPTSETIIGELFSRWVQSYRDLPLLINQWANVVRWEMRPRLFLRTSEFLWQEGHTVHETSDEAMEETRKMLDVYTDFCQDFLSIPVLRGEKTANERFPGAVSTLCIEAMMQDGKALQAGTSHFLGQNFAKSSNIQYLGKDGKQEYGWTTSWGVSTRLIGALIMTHADDDGLVLPPKVAGQQAIILPVTPKPDDVAPVQAACDDLLAKIKQVQFGGQAVRAQVDKRDLRGGEKNWQWVKKGVPLRIEIGPRDLAEGKVSLRRRDQPEERFSHTFDELLAILPELLQSIQDNLLARARARQAERTQFFDDRAAFEAFFGGGEDSLTSGGFAEAYWAIDEATEEYLKKTYKVTARCIPFATADRPGRGTCLFTGAPDSPLVVFARSY